jgi:hypothetical protein
MPLRLRAVRVLLFAAVTATIYAAELLVVARMPRVSRPEILAAAVLADLAVVVPLAYFLLFLRGKKWPVGLLPVFLLSLAGASLVLPGDYRHLLPRARLLVLPVEVGLVGFLLWRVRRIVAGLGAGGAETDVLERLDEGFGRVLPNRRLASALAYECAVLYYGLLGWWRQPARAAGHSFSYHRNSGYGALILTLMVVSAAEVVGLHLAVRLWSGTAAWLLSALGVYAVLWMAGDYQAVRLRPVVAADDALRVRVGLRWSASIPYSQIEQVRPRGKESLSKRTPGYLHAALLTDPQMVLVLRGPVRARGPYGIEKEVWRVGLAVDEADRLRAVLAVQCGTGPPSNP